MFFKLFQKKKTSLIWATPPALSRSSPQDACQHHDVTSWGEAAILSGPLDLDTNLIPGSALFSYFLLKTKTCGFLAVCVLICLKKIISSSTAILLPKIGAIKKKRYFFKNQCWTYCTDKVCRILALMWHPPFGQAYYFLQITEVTPSHSGSWNSTGGITGAQ